LESIACAPGNVRCQASIAAAACVQGYDSVNAIASSGASRTAKRSGVTIANPAPPPRSAQRSRRGVLRAAHDAAVGEHDGRRAQGVGRDAVAAHEAPEAAAERQAGDPDRRAGADRQRAAVGEDEVAVDVEHVRPAADPRDRPVALEPDAVDARDVATIPPGTFE
jgi:hypothetical protein